MHNAQEPGSGGKKGVKQKQSTAGTANCKKNKTRIYILLLHSFLLLVFIVRNQKGPMKGP
jgi:hypothetical protein